MRNIKNISIYFWYHVVLRTTRNSIFKLSTNKRQRRLIMENACIFLGLQNHGKNLDDLGCVVESMDVSGESFKYVGRLADYCEIKGIDIGVVLKQYDK